MSFILDGKHIYPDEIESTARKATHDAGIPMMPPKPWLAKYKENIGDQILEPDPEKHKFIGYFRPLESDYYKGHDNGWSCGECGKYGYQYNHVKNGCFDIPIYETIKEGS